MKFKAWVLALAFAALALSLAKTGHPTQKINAGLFDGNRPIPTWSEGNNPMPPWQVRS
ncbi:MAG: hypothetical protein WB780_10955 [Candidatus Acidiferrales bacterium]